MEVAETPTGEHKSSVQHDFHAALRLLADWPGAPAPVPRAELRGRLVPITTIAVAVMNSREALPASTAECASAMAGRPVGTYAEAGRVMLEHVARVGAR